MSDKNWEDKYIVGDKPKNIPGTVVENWEDKYLVPGQEAKKKSRFVPSIGGEDLTPFGKLSMGPIDVEYPRSIKSAIGAGFGGPAARGMPFIKDLIPTTEHDIKHMEEHPTMEKVGNIAGRVVAGIPQAMVMPFGTGAVGTLGNMGVQGTLNALLGTSERAVHNKETPKLDREALEDYAWGTAGPAIGKIVSPFVYPKAKQMKIGGIDEVATKGMTRPELHDYAQKFVDKSTKFNAAQNTEAALAKNSIENSHIGIDKGLDYLSQNPIAKWGLPIAAGAASHHVTGSIAMDALAAAAAHWGPGVLKNYVGNQVMQPTTQAILNSIMSGQRSGE